MIPIQVPSEGGRKVNVLGIPMVIRIHGHDTGGIVSAVESHDVPDGGPPPHIHSREDETFQVLEGEYEFTVDPIGSFRADDESHKVNPGACWDITLSRSPHAQLGGRVQRSDGSPVPQVDVLIMLADESWFTTEKADERGYFHVDSLHPGKYVVGINLPGAPAWKYAGCGGACEAPPASLYYPGVNYRSAALTITLDKDEKRDNIDFIIPTQ